MGSRIRPQGVARDRTYTVALAARAVGVSEHTLRKWGKQGLRIIRDRRPHLVRGADLQEFIAKRRKGRRAKLGSGQFYCLRCKAPRAALAGSVVFTSTTALTGRLSGLCAGCGAKVVCFCKASDGD